MISGRIESGVRCRNEDGGSTPKLQTPGLRKIRPSSSLSTDRRNRFPSPARRQPLRLPAARPVPARNRTGIFLLFLRSVGGLQVRNLFQTPEKADLFGAGGDRGARGSILFLPVTREEQGEPPKSGSASADQEPRLARRRTEGNMSARRLSGFGFALKPEAGMTAPPRLPVAAPDGSATSPVRPDRLSL